MASILFCLACCLRAGSRGREIIGISSVIQRGLLEVSHGAAHGREWDLSSKMLQNNGQTKKASCFLLHFLLVEGGKRHFGFLYFLQLNGNPQTPLAAFEERGTPGMPAEGGQAVPGRAGQCWSHKVIFSNSAVTDSLLGPCPRGSDSGLPPQGLQERTWSRSCLSQLLCCSLEVGGSRCSQVLLFARAGKC